LAENRVRASDEMDVYDLSTHTSGEKHWKYGEVWTSVKLE